MIENLTGVNGELASRFPILEQISFVQDGATGSPQPMIPFLGVLLSTLEHASNGATCVVLPTRTRLPFALAVISAFRRIKRDFKDLELDRLTTPLELGQLVHVAPKGWVYELRAEGKQIGGERWIALRALRDDQIHHIRDQERFRLTPSDTGKPTSPKGAGPGHWAEFPIDQLLETRTGGNLAIIPNQVVLVTSRSDSQIMAETTLVCRRGQDSRTPLSDVVTWGRLSKDGAIVSEDRKDLNKESIIAVTRSVDYAAALCEKAESESRVIIIDGARPLIGNLQGFDSASNRQRLMIIASHDELAQVAMLERRGCRVWSPTPAAVLLDQPSKEPTSWFSPVRARVEHWTDLKIVHKEVEDHKLSALYQDLESSAKSGGGNEDEALEKLVWQGYSLLLQLAEWVTKPGSAAVEAFLASLASADRTFAGCHVWLGAEERRSFRQFLNSCRDHVADNSNVGSVKGAALLESLNEHSGTGVVARSAAGAARIHSFLEAHDHPDIPVFHISSIQPGDYDRLTIVSWPGRDQMSGLVHKYLCSDLEVLGYPFELSWLQSFRGRWDQEWRRFHLPGDKIRSITGINSWPNAEHPLRSKVSPQPETDADPVTRILANRRKSPPPQSEPGADDRDATYVGFHGDGYAFLTETHKIPVVTDLVLNGDAAEGRVHRRSVRKIRLGDFLLFRDQGARDVIAVLAEHEMGSETYQRLRTQANRWREALQSISRTPDHAWLQLSAAGLSKNPLTVHSWMTDEDMIGPGSRKDLEIIGTVSGDLDLQRQLDEVETAIRAIRGAHSQAGATLSRLLLKELPEGLPDLDESGARVELGFVGGRIVCVDEIGDRAEPRPASEVNRLMEAEAF